MEVPIRQKFIGKTFFFAALGIHFKFDTQTQYDLWNLISENEIEQVLFVSNISNVFYKEAFEKQRNFGYPIDEVLFEKKRKVTNHQRGLGVFHPNLHLLAACHLAEQKERFLSTDYLGKLIINADIAVKAYVYEPKVGAYYRQEEVMKKGEVLNDISYN